MLLQGLHLLSTWADEQPEQNEQMPHENLDSSAGAQSTDSGASAAASTAASG